MSLAITEIQVDKKTYIAAFITAYVGIFLRAAAI